MAEKENTRTLLAANLREVRGERTLKDFCGAIGMDPSEWSGYENRRKSPSIEKLVEICNRLDLSPAWLLLGVGPRERSILESIPAAWSKLPPSAMDILDYVLQQDSEMTEEQRSRFYPMVLKTFKRYAEMPDNEAGSGRLQRVGEAAGKYQNEALPEAKKKHRRRH